MTAADVFEKMDRLKVTRAELAARVDVFPQTLTDLKTERIGMTEADADRLAGACDEIVRERLEKDGVEKEEVAVA